MVKLEFGGMLYHICTVPVRRCDYQVLSDLLCVWGTPELPRLLDKLVTAPRAVVRREVGPYAGFRV